MSGFDQLKLQRSPAKIIAARDRRITELEEALRNLIDRLDAVKPEIDKVTMLAWTHGNRYTGPTYEKELSRAREAMQ